MPSFNRLFLKKLIKKGVTPSIDAIKKKKIKFMELNMQFIYIENYLMIKKEEKMSFFKFINSSDKFRITNQKVILSDNSILLELSADSDASVVKAYVQSFFKSHDEIAVNIVNKIVKSDSTLILTIKDLGEKKIKI